MVLCLKVPKKDTERIRQLLFSKGWLSTDRAIGHEDECALLPIKSQAMNLVRALSLGSLVEVYLPPLASRPRSLAEALDGRLNSKEMEQLIGAFDIIGDIAILEIPPALQSHRAEIANAVLLVHPQVKVVAQKTAGTGGPYRIRPVEVIAGESRTLTICRESGCSFAIDLNAAYYTPRWSAERLRIAQLIKPGEKIIVAFAGIGPYPIVFEKHASPSAIAAIELNPEGVALMRRNLELNHCHKIEAIEGDAAAILSAPRFRAWADRLLMPHPSEAGRFLPWALPALREGGTLHYYCFASSSDPLPIAMKEATTIARAAGYSVKLLGGRIVRPYSASLVQVVLDLEVHLMASQSKPKKKIRSAPKPKSKSRTPARKASARTARPHKSAARAKAKRS